MMRQHGMGKPFHGNLAAGFKLKIIFHQGPGRMAHQYPPRIAGALQTGSEIHMRPESRKIFSGL